MATLLRINQLSKFYFRKTKLLKKALEDISFDLHQGEILGLLGVNGAGKTTLSSILASLNPPTTGEVLWKEKSIYKDLLNYRRIVGFCPQKPNLDKNFSIEKSLVFAGRIFGLTQTQAVQQKDLLIEKLGLKEYSEASAEILSGGYRQRFLIARTLMHKPKLVILDEPTVGLDPHVRRHLWEVIKELKSDGITVLLTTHYLDEAEVLSDRVCLIHEGRIRTIESPEKLKASHQKSNLEEVFLKFVDDPEAEIFNSGTEYEK